MRRKEDRKWVLHFKRKHPSVVIEGGVWACGWRQDVDGRSVHGVKKTPKKQQQQKNKKQTASW